MVLNRGVDGELSWGFELELGDRLTRRLDGARKRSAVFGLFFSHDESNGPRAVLIVADRAAQDDVHFTRTASSQDAEQTDDQPNGSSHVGRLA